ncbi:MAG TPA: hypothetical protein VGV38_22355, partial [Pyrinomonadaceae bacterium]|nr:hypothetical protein [Pyrinomonadaceae bacterium]
YRLFEERDLPGLLRLWEEAGWGTLTAEQWRGWFVETPNGQALVAVAVDEAGKVVAQEMFMPSRVWAAGREVRALRFSAPILNKELRGESLRRAGHPVVELYKTAARAAARAGFSVVYSLPEYAWLPVFRYAERFGLPRFAEASYPCVALPLGAAGDNGAGSNGEGFVARAVEEFGEEFDELWHEARESFPVECGVVRDSAWLRFRNSGRISVEVREASGNKLVGYTATKRQTGLLLDVLARRPEELGAVISASAGWLASERGRLAPDGWTELKAMRTPTLARALDALGFAPSDYRFAFTCNTFDPSLALEQIAPERWYIMPGD